LIIYGDIWPFYNHDLDRLGSRDI